MNHLESARFQFRPQTQPAERRKRVLVLLAIVLLHLMLLFLWRHGKRHVSEEQGPLLLPIWNVIEPRPIEKKPEQNKPESKPQAAASHPSKVQSDKRASAATTVQQATEPVMPNPQAATPAAPAANQIAPRLDYDSIRNQALDIDKHREITPAERAAQENYNHPQTVESGMADAAKRGTRGDCQTAYAGAGLLAIIPLAIDTVTGHGCKWK